jgi:RimJ/RimL family protein N-acetyltransferase
MLALNGTFEIREICASDAPAFLDLRKQLDTETDFLMLEPGERRATVEQTRAHIRDVLAQSNSTILVVEDQGELVGYLEVSGGRYRRNRHSAHLVVALRKSHMGQGIGKRLFSRIETWARERDLHRLELTVMTHNRRAVALYQKMGFEIEGTKWHALKVDGRFVNEYYMGKLLT